LRIEHTRDDTPRIVGGCEYAGRVPALDHRDRVQRFVLRARRVLAHSLVRDNMDLLNDAAHGTFHVNVEVNTKTGEGKHRFKRDLPPEEAFESLAARLRPFVMRKESVYWAVVLDSVEQLLSKETLAEVVDIPSLREYWSTVVEGSQVAAQAYYVMTESGKLSDVQLADLWLNSDSLHTQPIKSGVGNDLSITERYHAAAGVYARIGACVQYTYFWIDWLVGLGLLELDKSAFTDQVVADSSIDIETKAYCTPLGAAPMPTDLSEMDLSKWKPVHEDPAVVDWFNREKQKAQEAEDVGETKDVGEAS
jgi:hypothetical protein